MVRELEKHVLLVEQEHETKHHKEVVVRKAAATRFKQAIDSKQLVRQRDLIIRELKIKMNSYEREMKQNNFIKKKKDLQHTAALFTMSKQQALLCSLHHDNDKRKQRRASLFDSKHLNVLQKSKLDIFFIIDYFTIFYFCHPF